MTAAIERETPQQEFSITYRTEDGTTGFWKGQRWTKGTRDAELRTLIEQIRSGELPTVVSAWATEDGEPKS